MGDWVAIQVSKGSSYRPSILSKTTSMSLGWTSKSYSSDTKCLFLHLYITSILHTAVIVWHQFQCVCVWAGVFPCQHQAIFKHHQQGWTQFWFCLLRDSTIFPGEAFCYPIRQPSTPTRPTPDTGLKPIICADLGSSHNLPLMFNRFFRAAQRAQENTFTSVKKDTS